MPRRATLHRIKLHRTYTIEQAAGCVGVTPPTIRRWCKDGLRIMAKQRPYLILGADLKDWMKERRAPKSKPLPVGQMRCLSCKQTLPPAFGVLDYIPKSERHGMLKGFCGNCEGTVTRIVSRAHLPAWSATCTIG